MTRGRASAEDRKELRITLGATHDDAFQPSLSFANGDWTMAHAVARGDLALASINPSAYLTMARRGTGPYRERLPLRPIAVMPTWDRMFFAVQERTGIRSLSDIAANKPALRVSVRRNPGHGTRFVMDELFGAHGFALGDFEVWGGEVVYVDTPNDPVRFAAIRDGSLDAVFDEGIKGWGVVAVDSGMRCLDLDPQSLAHLAALGWPVGPVKTHFPKLPEEITAVSFGGWPLIVREDLPDEVAYSMCAALDAGRSRIAFDYDDPVELSDLCGGTDAAPRDVPLHPGAARYYREHGCIIE
jgi:TRAP-type uncharacterized transport system substrate-binding protein